MREDGPYIEVQHSGNVNGAQAVASTYQMDSGVLSLPEHISIGQKGHDGSKIENYSQQVDEYAIWLEDQIKAGNAAVMKALDDIYNLAADNGVILVTSCCPSPWITHAHVVKRVINSLAGE